MINQEFKAREENVKCCLISRSVAGSYDGSWSQVFTHACMVSALLVAPWFLKKLNINDTYHFPQELVVLVEEGLEACQLEGVVVVVGVHSEGVVVEGGQHLQMGVVEGVA